MRSNAEYQRAWYQRNRTKAIADRIRERERRHKELIQWVNSLKKKPCKDCGGEFPVICMDFDHLDRATKVASVSMLVQRGVAKSKIFIETQKCDVVCSNCHRIRTFNRRDHCPLIQ